MANVSSSHDSRNEDKVIVRQVYDGCLVLRPDRKYIQHGNPPSNKDDCFIIGPLRKWIVNQSEWIVLALHSTIILSEKQPALIDPLHLAMPSELN